MDGRSLLQKTCSTLFALRNQSILTRIVDSFSRVSTLPSTKGRFQGLLSGTQQTLAHRICSTMSSDGNMTALVPIANGSEEIEAVSIIDTLRRTKKIQVDVVSVTGSKEVTMSRDVKMVADKLIDEVKNDKYDIIILPGGAKGAEQLRDCEPLTCMLKQQKADGKRHAAICASPGVVFAHHGILGPEDKATAYPSFVDRLPNQSSALDRVVVNGNCITSRSPGTALEFAVKLVEIMCGKEDADKLAEGMLVRT